MSNGPVNGSCVQILVLANTDGVLKDLSSAALPSLLMGIFRTQGHFSLFDPKMKFESGEA